MARSYSFSAAALAGRAARRQATRQALVEAARSLAARRGIASLSVTEVARQAGVSHSLINSYFGGKAGLIAELMRERGQRRVAEGAATAAGPGSVEARLRAVLVGWAAFDLADPALFRVLQAHGWEWSDRAEAAHRREQEALMAPLARLWAEGRAAGRFRSDMAEADVLAAIWAIYGAGMRAAVFAAPIPQPEQAIAAIWGQIAAIVMVPSPMAEPVSAPVSAVGGTRG